MLTVVLPHGAPPVCLAELTKKTKAAFLSELRGSVARPRPGEPGAGGAPGAAPKQGRREVQNQQSRGGEAPPPALLGSVQASRPLVPPPGPFCGLPCSLVPSEPLVHPPRHLRGLQGPLVPSRPLVHPPCPWRAPSGSWVSLESLVHLPGPLCAPSRTECCPLGPSIALEGSLVPSGPLVRPPDPLCTRQTACVPSMPLVHQAHDGSSPQWCPPISALQAHFVPLRAAGPLSHVWGACGQVGAEMCAERRASETCPHGLSGIRCAPSTSDSATKEFPCARNNPTKERSLPLTVYVSRWLACSGCMSCLQQGDALLHKQDAPGSTWSVLDDTYLAAPHKFQE